MSQPIDPVIEARIEELVKAHGNPTRVLAFLMEAAEPVVEAAEVLYEAKTIIEQGDALRDLSNAVGDLASWLPHDDKFR